MDTYKEYCIVVEKETDSNVIPRKLVMRRTREIQCMPDENSLSFGQVIEQSAVRVEIEGRCGESRMENQRITAGPTVKTPVGTSRYKYLPNSHLTKSIST